MNRIQSVVLALRHEAGALFGWWTAQLHELAGQLFASVLPQLRTRTLVTLGSTQGQISVLRGGEFKPLFAFRKEDNGAWPADLHSFGSVEVIQSTRTAIALAGEFAITREISLPETAEHELNRLIPLYLEREFPLTLDAICFNYQIVRRVRALRQITARIVIVRRDELNRVLATASGWGLNVVQIGLSDGAAAASGNFLQRKTLRRPRRLAAVERWLLASSGALCLIFFGIVAVEWSRERNQVAQILSREQANAQAVQSLLKSLTLRAAPAVSLASIQRQEDVTGILTTLTEITPVDTWLYQLEIDATPDAVPKITLSAFTPASMDYVTTLEQAPEFQHVKVITSAAGFSSNSKKAKLTAEWSAAAAVPERGVAARGEKGGNT